MLQVVGQGIDAPLRKPRCDVVHPLAAAAVNDAGLARVPLCNEIVQLAFAVFLQLHPVADVRPVKTRHELRCLAQIKLLENFPAGCRVGRGRQRHAGNVRESTGHGCDLKVLRPKIVPPL